MAAVCFFSFPPTEASSGGWPTVLTARASCSVSGNIPPYRSKTPENAAKRRNACCPRESIPQTINGSYGRPEPSRNATASRISPENGMKPVWQSFPKSIRELSCTGWRPTFFRPSARRISPNLRHGTLWRSSSLWNRGETTRLPGEYCKSSVRCSAMRSSRAGRNRMSQPICGEPCDREKLFTGRQCWNRRKSVSFCGISTPMKAISLWSVP